METFLTLLNMLVILVAKAWAIPVMTLVPGEPASNTVRKSLQLQRVRERGNASTAGFLMTAETLVSSRATRRPAHCTYQHLMGPLELSEIQSLPASPVLG